MAFFMKMNFMIYGLFQYYNDELTSWNRIIAFHKVESRELVRQVTVVLDQQIISSAVEEKEGNSFIDQFIVQEQEFDHITNRITSQQQRLERTASSPGKPIEDLICHQQDLLRTRMQHVERNFIRTKYNCSIFLATLLNDQLLGVLKTKNPEFAG